MSRTAAARNIVANGPCDPLPGGLVLRSGTQSQQSAEVFHSAKRVTLFIDIEAMDYQGVAISRD